MDSIKDGRALRQQNIYDLNRERLINTAVQVINEIGDIREVTLTQIAKEAGVSPATAYNHFPERMEDVYSAIVHSKMDVAANMGATITDSSLSPIEKLKKIPLTYAENLVSLGYAGKVLLIQQFNLIKVDKWLDQDPVKAITALLASTDEYRDQREAIEQDMAPFGFVSDGFEEETFKDAQGDVWKVAENSASVGEYGDSSYMWDYR